MGGCTASNSPASSKPSHAPTALSQSPRSPTDVRDGAVIAAYTSSWDAQTEAYSKASSAGTSLQKNTTFKALADVERDLAAMRKAGQVTTGRPVIRPRVVTVTHGSVPTATVVDCVDTTNWTLVDKASKRKVPLPTTRLITYVSTATLEQWGTMWMVTKLTAQEQAC
ncbi:hypothetical protein [Streptomyces sp. TLI_146]|uniref:hypothetical protein n=1 Tax=Streptomyces sp. TLI_146 TaxID=1938858 RepID=UPI000C700ED8|nr:hypothetical protein [Streptomyces sp. TLI_146]PKV82706.1 hypothetical protein BX283_0152 [Streptomyces sp. TLI_146]